MKKLPEVISGSETDLLYLMLEKKPEILKRDGQYLFYGSERLHGVFSVSAEKLSWDRCEPVYFYNKSLTEIKNNLKEVMAIFYSHNRKNKAFYIEIQNRQDAYQLRWISTRGKRFFREIRIPKDKSTVELLNEMQTDTGSHFTSRNCSGAVLFESKFPRNLKNAIKKNYYLRISADFSFPFEALSLGGQSIGLVKSIERAPFPAITSVRFKNIGIYLNLIDADSDMEKEYEDLYKLFVVFKKTFKLEAKKEKPSEHHILHLLMNHDWIHYVGHGKKGEGLPLREGNFNLDKMQTHSKMPKAMIFSSCLGIDSSFIHRFFKLGGKVMVFFQGRLETSSSREGFKAFYWHLLNKGSTVRDAVKSMRWKMKEMGADYAKVRLYGNGTLRLKQGDLP